MQMQIYIHVRIYTEITCTKTLFLLIKVRISCGKPPSLLVSCPGLRQLLSSGASVIAESQLFHRHNTPFKLQYAMSILRLNRAKPSQTPKIAQWLPHPHTQRYRHQAENPRLYNSVSPESCGVLVVIQGGFGLVYLVGFRFRAYLQSPLQFLFGLTNDILRIL